MPNPYPFVAAAYAFLRAAMPAPDAVFDVLGQMTGNDAEAGPPAVLLAQTPAEWNQVWMRTFGAQVSGQAGVAVGVNQRPIPPVDFRQYVVLGVLGGSVRNGNGYQIVGVDARGERAVVRLRLNTLAAGGVSLVVNPYLFAVVTRTRKPIDVQFPDPGSQRWRTVATFPPTVIGR